jgi:hypothetical protein
VGNTPEDDAGVAGGIQTTSIQLGGVLGTAVCGSILAATVASVLHGDLVSRGVPPGLAATVSRDGAVVSQGRVPVPAGTAGKVVDAITQGSHAAFMAGLHTTMLVAGIVTLAGAGLGPLLRSKGPAQGDAPVTEAPDAGPVAMREESVAS